MTCFAYGQTGTKKYQKFREYNLIDKIIIPLGSGKTFTMMGDPGNENKENSIPGLYLLAAQDIVNLLETVFKIKRSI